MAKIEQWIIDKVKDAADIVKVVGESVTLRRAGLNFTGLCPFHDDRHTGNFIVSPKGTRKHANQFHCFVCGAHGNSIDFLQKHDGLSFLDAVRYIGKMECIEVDDVPVNYTPPPPKPVPPPLPRLTFKRATVLDSLKGVESTLFVRWISSLPWTEKQRERLAETLHSYCVAACPHGLEWVSFWQITHDGVPLTAKYMRYHPDGHRVNEKRPDGSKVFASDWEHAWRARQKQYDAEKYDTSGRALFGAHLLARYPQAVVNVVESEKTALIMANYYGGWERQLWLACGGLKFLKLDMMQPLIDQGRTVWLWPDRDGAKEWQTVADKLGSDKVQVYTRFFDTCWKPEDGDKADCADITIRMMTTGEKPRKTDTGDPQSTTEIIATASDQGGMNSAATPEPPATWDSDEPFLDPIELQDPRVREWRERMSHVHSSGWGKWPTCKVEGVKSVGEIIEEHPLLKKLI